MDIENVVLFARRLQGKGIGLLVVLEGKGIGFLVVLEGKGIRLFVVLGGKEQDCS